MPKCVKAHYPLQEPADPNVGSWHIATRTATRATALGSAADIADFARSTPFCRLLVYLGFR